MKIFQKYIGWTYFKYFVILFVALEFFYVGIDVLTNLKDFPQSANLGLLYIAITAVAAITYTLPLSLVFALIIAKFNMIRNNEFISFFALGVPKNSLIIPPFLIALFITFGYISLNNTIFVKAVKFQKNITNFASLNENADDLLLKYDGNFIYMSKLNPKEKTAKDVIFLETNGTNLISKAISKKGVYSDKKWLFSDVNTTFLPQNLCLGEQGLTYKFEKNAQKLNNFDPNTIKNVYDSSQTYTIYEAIKSIKTFKNQGINVQTLKANLFVMIFFPLFAPFMVLILYYYLPVISRFFNLALLSFAFFIITLCVWGILFVLVRFSLNGVIIPEIGIILPIFAMFCYACYLFLKHR